MKITITAGRKYLLVKEMEEMIAEAMNTLQRNQALLERSDCNHFRVYQNIKSVMSDLNFMFWDLARIQQYELKSYE